MKESQLNPDPFTTTICSQAKHCTFSIIHAAKTTSAHSGGGREDEKVCGSQVSGSDVSVRYLLRFIGRDLRLASHYDCVIIYSTVISFTALQPTATHRPACSHPIR